MASNPNEISLDMNDLYSVMAEIKERNPGISSLTWEWETSSRPSDCPSINTEEMQKPKNSNSPQYLGPLMLGLTFQAMFISLPNSTPLAKDLFVAAMLIGFAKSFAAILLRSAFPRFALWLEKCSALFAAIGFFIISSLLVHPKLAWISWMACGSCLLAFFFSFM